MMVNVTNNLNVNSADHAIHFPVPCLMNHFDFIVYKHLQIERILSYLFGSGKPILVKGFSLVPVITLKNFFHNIFSFLN